HAGHVNTGWVSTVGCDELVDEPADEPHVIDILPDGKVTAGTGVPGPDAQAAVTADPVGVNGNKPGLVGLFREVVMPVELNGTSAGTVKADDDRKRPFGGVIAGGEMHVIGTRQTIDHQGIPIDQTLPVQPVFPREARL